MSDTTPSTATAAVPADDTAADSRFTVEDTGSTTDAADLVDDDPADDAPAIGADVGTEVGTGVDSGAASPADDSAGHVFDQTNGVVEGIDGDSDGSAESDVQSPGAQSKDAATSGDTDLGDDHIPGLGAAER